MFDKLVNLRGTQEPSPCLLSKTKELYYLYSVNNPGNDRKKGMDSYIPVFAKIAM